MEKISRIVRGNARVAAVDNKNAAPVRPGMPTFGRPVGESTQATPKASSTAARAVALHKGLKEAKEAASQERVISRMADDFFMSRIRRPEESPVTAPGAAVQAPETLEGAPMLEEEIASTDELALAPDTQAPPEPREYTPRGSFVDVHA